jgi:hypothetical protein
MSRSHPLATLLTGGALAAGLLIASMAATPEQPAADDEAVPVVTDSPEPDETEPTAESDEDVDEPEPADTPDDTDEQTPPRDEAPEPVTYVGYVDGGGASVAVIVDGDEAIAYVCDGQSREAWLSGVAVDGQLELTGDRGSLSASYDDSIVEGEATVDGQAWTFSITQVDPPEGLYQFADTVAGGAEVVGGWIVLPDGSQVGAVNVDGETQPAEPLDVTTGQVTVEGEVVTAEFQGRGIDE